MTNLTRLITSLKRRSSHAKEFGHDVLFVKLEDIDALVEALKELRAQIDRQEDFIREQDHLIGNLKSNLHASMQRTVTVKLPKRSVGEVMLMSGFSRDYAEGWCAANDNAIHQICNTLGIKWGAE